jgi:nucleotide-binding universal stress UspA family protein
MGDLMPAPGVKGGGPDAAALPVATIAVGTDGSETATRAVEIAIDMAARMGSQLVVASCYEPASEHRLVREREEVPQDLQWSINPTGEVEATLRDAEDRARARGVRVRSEARVGKPAAVLRDIASDHAADLLVVGSRGMHRKHLPSVPNSVSHSAPCSVLIVKTA